MNHKLKKLMSWLCLFAMILSIMPSAAFGAVQEAVTADNGINGYAAALQADGVTAGEYINAFTADASAEDAQLIDGVYRSSALNGKLWADKSITVDEANKLFDVTVSALGQNFTTKEVTQSQVALDVVFVVDVSPSMGYGMSSSSTTYQSNASDTRMYALAEALNSAADVLMQNENNRMGVVAFGGSAKLWQD